MLDELKETVDIDKTPKQFISTNITHIIELLKQSSLNPDCSNSNINEGIFKDYYELIKTNITLEKNITYLFHIISREISNSTEEKEKKLIMILLPEFYTPFKFKISLTYPYLSRVLTTIQSNIYSNINPNFIGEIFSKILKNIFPDNLENFDNKSYEICQGFCVYNMKQNDIRYQLAGVICLNKLICESNYYLNYEKYINYLWEKIILFCDNENFIPKNILLKCLSNFISKCKLSFKPYINITLYKLLNFFENKDCEIRKESLNVLLVLVTYCPNEMISYKSLLIDFLNILQKDEVQHIRINSSLILQKIKGNSKLHNNISSYNSNYFNNINQINNKKKYFFNNVLKNNSTNANTITQQVSQTFSVNKYQNNDATNNKIINLKNYATQKIPTNQRNYLCNSVNNLHRNTKQNINKESIFKTQKNDNFFMNYPKGIFIKDNYRTFSNGVEYAKNDQKNEENKNYNVISNRDNTIKNNSEKKNNYCNKDLNVFLKNSKKDNRLNDILNEVQKMNDRQASIVKALEGLNNELCKSTTNLKTRINNLEFIFDNNKNNN